MYTQNLLTGLGLLAAGAVIVWFRTGSSQPAKTRRERLRKVAWCAGLLLIALTVAGVFRSRYLVGYGAGHPTYVADTAYSAILRLSLAAAVIVILRPSLGRRLVPVALIGVGLDGLALSSPAGGPTMVVMEVPCASSSLKTSSC